MRECEICGNYIPHDVFICPHCGVIGSGWPRMLLGIVLLIAVPGFGICVYQWHRGIESAVLPFISALIAIPAGAWGAILFFRGKMAIRAKRYKAHTNHDFTDSCFCKICGKHNWLNGPCEKCGKSCPHVWAEHREIKWWDEENYDYLGPTIVGRTTETTEYEECRLCGERRNISIKKDYEQYEEQRGR